MVTIIEEPNKNLNKNLFLKELHKQRNGKLLKITKVSKPFKGRNNEDFIYIDFKVLEDFIGYFKENSRKPLNIKGEIISIPFTLSKFENNEYKINTKKNIFSILNLGLIKKNMIPETNVYGFLITYEEIITALNNLEFKAVSKLVKSKEFNNYLKLDIN